MYVLSSNCDRYRTGSYGGYLLSSNVTGTVLVAKGCTYFSVAEADMVTVAISGYLCVSRLVSYGKVI